MIMKFQYIDLQTMAKTKTKTKTKTFLPPVTEQSSD